MFPRFSYVVLGLCHRKSNLGQREDADGLVDFSPSSNIVGGVSRFYLTSKIVA